MKILITGGCGFIGSNFIRGMLARHRDWRVINLDALTYAGNPENLSDIDASAEGRYRLVRGDIAVPEAVEEAIGGGVDAVCNFAAESHVDRSIEEAAPFVRTNVAGTQVLLDAARAARVSRFLQVSTDEVYGALPLDAPDRFSEATPLAPRSPYAASKAAADLLVHAAFVTHGQEAVITRCSNNYGPWQFPEKFIPQMILNALDNRPLPVYGDGLYVRDWLHVEDHVNALEAVLMRGEPGRVYNIGGDCERPNIEVARRVLAITGRSESLIRQVADRPAHDRRYAIDATLCRQALGWAPMRDFEQGLAETVAWYRDHEPWWRRILSGDYLVERRSARA